MSDPTIHDEAVRRQSHVESLPRLDSSDSDDSDASSDEAFSEKDHDHDGHRPSMREMRRSSCSSRSSSRRRKSANGASGSGSGLSLARTPSRTESMLSRIRSRQPTTQFTHPLARQRTKADQLVEFDGPDDPYKPINWPTKKKTITTMIYGLVTMTATWASSAYSAGTAQVAAEFHVGMQTATLGTTLFLFGFGVGPLLWAPLSEVYGRRAAVLVPMVVAICFTFGSATAKDFQTLMITRFFGAFFASAPVTNTGGVLGDLYSPAWRGIAMAGYAMAVVGGPALGRSCFSVSVAACT